MTPIAAYYIHIANDQARAAAAARRIDVRLRGPSLLDRVRTLAAALRGQPSRAGLA
jgi:hypothetical protein